jgi:hypothetical protein
MKHVLPRKVTLLILLLTQRQFLLKTKTVFQSNVVEGSPNFVEP